MPVVSTFLTSSYGVSGFANIAQWVSNSLKAVGLIRVASSRPAVAGGGNQAADYTGVANPVATSTALEWEIWRFADALHATSPIYFRIYWRTGSGTSTIVLAVKVGTGFDGVSDVNGNVYAEQQLISTTGAAGSTAYQCHVIGDTNRVIIALWMGQDAAGTTPYICFGLERLHNSDGTDNDEGAFVFTQYGSSTTTHNNQVISRPSFGGNGNLETKLGNALMPRNQQTMFGFEAAIGAIYPMRGRALYPSRNFVVVGKADLGAGDGILNFSHYYAGQSQLWRNATRQQTRTFEANFVLDHGLLMRFD